MHARRHPLLERADHLDRLTELLADAASGHGRMVRITGEAGAGKTSLCEALADHARTGGWEVLAASAGQLETGTPHSVVRRQFDRALRRLDADELARIVAGPASLAAELVLGTHTGTTESADLITSLYWLLDAFATNRPIVLVADDLQWADDESLRFLGSLRERLAELPVLVVLASRDVPAGDRSPALAALFADRRSVSLPLAPLSPSAVGSLLEERWGTQVTPQTRSAVSEVTGGNPFLVVELADLLGDQGDASPARVRSAVPSSVVDAVVARVAGLPAPGRELATALAVLDSAPTRLVGDLAGLDLAAATTAADQLRRVGLVDEESPLRYRHALLRSGVLAASSPGAVTLMRRRAARLLADQPHAAAAQLLETEGQGDPWAVELLRAAAASSLAEGAPHTAVGLLRRAVAEPPSAEELPDTLVELGMAEMRTADAACVETLSRAESLLPSALDRARVAMALAEAFNYAGFHALAVEVLDRAYADVAGQDGELDLQVEAALIAASLLVPEHLADGRRRLAAHPDVPGNTPGERQLCQQLTYNAVATNQPAAVIREFAHRAIGPDDTPETTDWVWARLFLTAIGDFDDVRRLADHGLAQAAERNSVLGHVTASFVRAQADLWSGHLVAAEGHFRALLDHAANLGTGELAQTLGAAGMAQTLALQGRVAEAVATLEPYPQEMPAHSPGNGVAAMVFAHAVVGMATGDLDRVLRAGAQGEELARRLDVDSPTWAAWRAVVIEPLRLRGDLDSARARAVEHLALCERAGVPHLLGEALRLGGRVAADPEEGLELLRRSAEVLAGSGALLQQAATEVAYGAALRRVGRRSEARDRLVAGHRLAHGCGAAPLAAEAATELAALGTRVRPDRSASAATLTASELRVVELAAAGQSNAEIARTLFISLKTVETHLSRSYRKLEIGGRDGLAEALSG